MRSKPLSDFPEKIGKLQFEASRDPDDVLALVHEYNEEGSSIDIRK